MMRVILKSLVANLNREFNNWFPFIDSFLVKRNVVITLEVYVLKSCFVRYIEIDESRIDKNTWFFWLSLCKIDTIFIVDLKISLIYRFTFSTVHWLNSQYDVVRSTVNCFKCIDFATKICHQFLTVVVDD